MLRPLPAVARAQQCEVKGRVPRRLCGKGARRRRACEPAGFRSARHRGRAAPQQENRHARAFCGQCKAAARGEIIGFRRPPDVDDHRAKRLASRPFKAGLQRGWHITGANEQKKPRIKSQFRQPGRMRRAGLAWQGLVTNPEHRLSSTARTQHQREGRKAHAIGLGSAVEFMQGRRREGKAGRWTILTVGRSLGSERHDRVSNVHDMFL